MNSERNEYTTQYEWMFSKCPRLITGGQRVWRYEVTLTVPSLAEEELAVLLERFRLRFGWLTGVILELQTMEITNQLCWRSFVLMLAQAQQTFFDLEHIGFLLLAHQIPLGANLRHLHELLQTFLTLSPFPDMEAYYRLPSWSEDPPTLQPAPSVRAERSEARYEGDVLVELTGHGLMRQRRTLHLSEPLTAGEVEALALATACNHTWNYDGMQDGTLEVSILHRPSEEGNI